MSQFSGSEWVKSIGKPMSSLGERVADMLGDLFLGIYHIERDVRRADWTTTAYISMTVRGTSWATWDGENLTRLVVLAHDRCIRVEMEAAAPRLMRLSFYPRDRVGPIHKRHPTLEWAAIRHRTF